MGYVSAEEHVLVDMRLYMPKEWTKDRQRREKAGVPKEVRYCTRHQLCLEMLDQHGDKLPRSWIAGDDELGRPYTFRRRLDRRGERYLLAVPSNTTIRDLETGEPPYSGHGRPPKRPWQRVDNWVASLPKRAWMKVNVRDGSKGPLVIEVTKRRVVGRNHRRQEGHEEMLVVIRYRDRENRRVIKTDYYLSNASADVKLAEFARVAKAEHRIEECIQRAKSEAGLADYEVRNWKGWHHHQTLSMLATWFLVVEARRGKKKVVPFHRWDEGGKGDDVIVLVNFRNQAFDQYRVGFPAAGLWRLRFNSDWAGYSDEFGDHPNVDVEAVLEERDGYPASAELSIGAYGILIFSQCKQSQ